MNVSGTRLGKTLAIAAGTLLLLSGCASNEPSAQPAGEALERLVGEPASTSEAPGETDLGESTDSPPSSEARTEEVETEAEADVDASDAEVAEALDLLTPAEDPLADTPEEPAPTETVPAVVDASEIPPANTAPDPEEPEPPVETAPPPAVEAGPEPEDPCEVNPASCEVAGEDFSDSDLNSSVFFEADVQSAIFVNSNLSDSDFSGAQAANADFTGATLADSIIVGADFSGADFTNANLTDAFVFDTALADAVWNNTICPDGTNSDANNGTCEGTF